MIPPQFLGLGIEYQTLPLYTGTDPNAVDPVFEQLVQNLTPGQIPVLRIGGDTTDWSWWPVRGMHAPPGVSYSLTPRWAAVARSLTQRLNAHLILGINFQVDSRTVARVEAAELIRRLGQARIDALELGNEPELYHTFGYKDGRGKEVPARAAKWGFRIFEREFRSIGSSLPAGPLAGPTTGNLYWDGHFGRFLSDVRKLRIATVHRYPLWICSNGRSPYFPNVNNLLRGAVTTQLVGTVAPLVRIARAHKLPLRLDEMNATPCPHQALALRGSIATALWVMDYLFAMARVGVDGVNVQTSTGSTQDLFEFRFGRRRWVAKVAPEYYGLLMFAKAAPAGSSLVPLSQAPEPLHAWATRGPGETFRVLVINDGRGARTVALRGIPTNVGATVERLLSVATPGGRLTTLGGQTLGMQTATGHFPELETTSVASPHGDTYELTLPGLSAALLTVG